MTIETNTVQIQLETQIGKLSQSDDRYVGHSRNGNSNAEDRIQWVLRKTAHPNGLKSSLTRSLRKLNRDATSWETSQQTPGSVGEDLQQKDQKPNIADSQERRTLPRRESHSRVSIQRLQQGHETTVQQSPWQIHSSRIKGTLIDLSLQSASVVIDAPVSGGDRVLIEIHNPQFDQRIEVLASVLRVQKSGNEQWDVICSFEKRIPLEDVEMFGSYVFQSNLV